MHLSRKASFKLRPTKLSISLVQPSPQTSCTYSDYVISWKFIWATGTDPPPTELDRRISDRKSEPSGSFGFSAAIKIVKSSFHVKLFLTNDWKEGRRKIDAFEKMSHYEWKLNAVEWITAAAVLPLDWMLVGPVNDVNLELPITGRPYFGPFMGHTGWQLASTEGNRSNRLQAWEYQMPYLVPYKKKYINWLFSIGTGPLMPLHFRQIQTRFSPPTEVRTHDLLFGNRERSWVPPLLLVEGSSWADLRQLSDWYNECFSC